MSVGSFNDRWDSGQVGWIYCRRSTAIKEWGRKCDYVQRAYDYLKGEVEDYDKYLTGQVCGYIGEVDGEEIEDGSCWGFLDSKDCLEEGKVVAENYHNRMIEAEQFEKVAFAT